MHMLAGQWLNTDLQLFVPRVPASRWGLWPQQFIINLKKRKEIEEVKNWFLEWESVTGLLLISIFQLYIFFFFFFFLLHEGLRFDDSSPIPKSISLSLFPPGLSSVALCIAWVSYVYTTCAAEEWGIKGMINEKQNKKNKVKMFPCTFGVWLPFRCRFC